MNRWRDVAVASMAISLFAGGLRAEEAQEPRSATFEVRHQLDVVVPEGAKQVRVWFAMPQDEADQKVSGFRVDSPYPTSITKDSEGNTSVFLEVTAPAAKSFSIVETFRLTRSEARSGADAAKTRPLTAADREAQARYLGSNANIIVNDDIRRIATETIGGETNPVLAARKLYDWTLANIDYWVKDPVNRKASPLGSSVYCLTSRTGNCSDFNSLWTALSRSAGIPTRMVYGSLFKAELEGADRDQSYHCWAEFWVPGAGWIVHDVAVADIFVGDFPTTPDNAEKVRLTTAAGYFGPDKSKVDYYFGNLDERRVVWSRGRDLTLVPRQAGGPVNALAKAYVEVDGQIAEEKTVWTRKLTYSEAK